MAQNYKVYFANRPVFFTQDLDRAVATSKGAEVFRSAGKTDTLFIESAISKGANAIYILCEDVEKSWSAFFEQFEFVQAAGGLVVNPKHEILFIFRQEKWDLPKGKVEANESIPEGALREVEEECSIFQLQPIRPLCTTWHTYIQKGEPMLKATQWFQMAYAGSKTPEPQIIEGITEVRWIKKEDLAMVTKNTYPSIIDVIESYLQK
jgi:ADP-ribose pyrophosphatase YjhB (NUDIX family)